MVDSFWLLTLQQLKDLQRQHTVSLQTGYLERYVNVEVLARFWFRHLEKPATTLGFAIYYNYSKTHIRVETGPEWSHNFQGERFTQFQSICRQTSDRNYLKISTGMVGTMCAFSVRIKDAKDDRDYEKIGYITLLVLARRLIDAGFIVPEKSG